MFVLFDNKTMGVVSGAGTTYLSEAHDSIPVFSGVRVAQSYVFFVVFCNSLFVLFSFFIYLWHCISFLDVRLLVTSNFSTSHEYHYLI